MATERRQPKREALVRATPLELRLYLAALLASVYTITWRAIGGHAPAAELPSPQSQQRFVWLDSLPSTARPAIALPAGWQIASESTAASAQPPRVVRAPTPRVPRVRTRSS